MASWQTVMTFMQQAVSAAMPVISPAPVVGIGWPALKRLQQLGSAGPLVSIYDRSDAKNRTRWTPFTATETVFPTGVSATLSAPAIAAFGSVTVTVGGTPNLNDAIGLAVTNGVNGSATMAGAVAISASGATAATMASALASAVNAEATLGAWMTASANANVVTLTGIVGALLRVAANVGNIASRATEVRRVQRTIQIVCWAATRTVLSQVCDPIEQALSAAQANFGYELGDGTWLRIVLAADQDIEDDLLQDAYRRDFFATVEYGITTVDDAYSVLIPIQALENNTVN